jgi:hypothetical protein
VKLNGEEHFVAGVRRMQQENSNSLVVADLEVIPGEDKQ